MVTAHVPVGFQLGGTCAPSLSPVNTNPATGLEEKVGLVVHGGSEWEGRSPPKGWLGASDLTDVFHQLALVLPMLDADQDDLPLHLPC